MKLEKVNYDLSMYFKNRAINKGREQINKVKKFINQP